MVSRSDKKKEAKPGKTPRRTSSKRSKKTAKPARKKATSTRKTTTKPKKKPVKGRKKTTAKRAKAAPKKKAPAKKKTVRAKKAPPRKPGRPRPSPMAQPTVRAPRPVELGPDVVLAPPFSTIEGTEPHAAAAANGVIAVRSTKYEVTPPDRIIEPVYPEERVTELPAGYGETRLVLLVRDPEWLFVYWEISQADRDMLGLAREGSIEPLVLRLYDVTGVEDFNGVNSVSWYEIPITAGASSWYVHLPQADRQWCAELGVLNELGEFVQICRSNQVHTPRNFISEEADAEWMMVSEELREILARSADMAVSSQLGSEEAIRLISRRLRLALEKHRASAALSGSLRARPPLAARPAQAELPLSVRTELVVSGTTDPQASVTVQGQTAEVRPNGTFSLRFELPDGEQVIAVRATSGDGTLTREIVPVVRKETRPQSGA